MSISKKIVLKSSDGKIFEVEEAVALQSQTIAHMIEDGCIDSEIPVDNVTGETLTKVIEYCKKHAVVLVPDGDSNSSSSSKEELKTWDAEFIKIDPPTLYNLILAANFLDVKNLLELGLQTLADMIPGKTPEEIRTIFNIANDFTPEEEAENRKDNPWAYD